MTNFLSFSGVVTEIHDMYLGENEDEGCNQLFTVVNRHGEVVNFSVSPSTYLIDQVSIGDMVTGYYDGDLPVILIYPPQYQAIVLVKEVQDQHVKVDYFNNQLISSDQQLQLNISPNTTIELTNGLPFNRRPANRDLVVIYGPTTHSIPAQTSPYKIIVLCRQTPYR